MGPMLHSATTPKLSASESLWLRRAVSPAPMPIIKGTVIGPVVTPPESKATAKNSLGTRKASRKTRA